MTNADLRFLCFGVFCLWLGFLLGRHLFTTGYLMKMKEDGRRAFWEGAEEAVEQVRNMSEEEFNKMFIDKEDEQ